MTDIYFFILGLVNSLSLITIFMVRKNHLSLVKKYGWTYLILSIPATIGLVLSLGEDVDAAYPVFYGIFLAFLVIEWLYDRVLKTDFRSDFRKNWPKLVPYLALYYAMNYGFVVMPWKENLVWGIIMAVIFVVQIVENLTGHGEKTD